MRIDRVTARQLEIALGLCQHPAKTFEDYLLRVGTYQGLQEAIEMEMADAEAAEAKEQKT